MKQHKKTRATHQNDFYIHTLYKQNKQKHANIPDSDDAIKHLFLKK